MAEPTAEANRALVARYYRALGARNWEAFARTLAEDVVYEVPQTRERVRGVAAYTDFNATFPGDWTLDLDRVVADETGAAAWITFRSGGEAMTGISFFELANGKIWRISDFWPQPYDPPARASRWVERY